MRYSPELYAKAFMETVFAAPKAKQKKLLLRFLQVLEKNGEQQIAEKIFDKIQEIITKKKEGRVVQLEFARDVQKQLAARLKRSFSKRDLISFSVRPELVSGVRVLIDGERELDMSLQRKLKKLFNGVPNS